MRALPGERVVYETGSLLVTTHRVRFDRQRTGRGTIKSIMLEEIASCAMFRLSHPWLLALAALCVFGGLLASFQVGVVAVVMGLLFGAACFLAFVFKREQVVAIASAGTTIFLNTQGWPIEQVRELLNQIETVKNARYLAVRNATPAGRT